MLTRPAAQISLNVCVCYSWAVRRTSAGDRGVFMISALLSKSSSDSHESGNGSLDIYHIYPISSSVL